MATIKRITSELDLQQVAGGVSAIQGEPGPVGPQGPAGPAGAKGDPGTGIDIKGSFQDPSELPATGVEGDAYLIAGNLYVWTGAAFENVGNIQGPQGPVGPVGPQGPVGPTGADSTVPGPQGEQGPQGIQGIAGPPGIQGAKGDQGDQGIQGIQGPKGDTGNAATVALGTVSTGAAGSQANITNAGTVNNAILNFTIPKGDKGDTGEASTVPGPQGEQGPQGIQGEVGPQGIQGETGPQGPAGSPLPRIQSTTATTTFNCDWSLYDQIEVTISGNCTFTFSGAANGQRCMLIVKQDATGSRTVTLPASVRFGANITEFTATTDANLEDKLGFMYRSGNDKYDIIAVAKGY